MFEAVTRAHIDPTGKLLVDANDETAE
jgi:hypothetical protein